MFDIYDDNDLKNLSEIKDFLDKHNIEYDMEYDNFCLFFGNPGGKRSYEIEYVSSRLYPIEYPKYGIEGVPSDYFFKLSYQAENEYNSFKCWVKDFEWNNDRKRDVLKSYFLHAAGKTPYRFYARDCEVKEVPTREARAFEAEHCFYGKRGASLNLGLYLKKDKNGLKAGTLLMIYTFGHNFFGKDNSVEVLRVGTRKFHQVIGGASKLLKYFIENYPYLKVGNRYIKTEKIKFYSDYDHNIGMSMDSLGFEFVGYSGGGFMNYWIETGEIKNREPMKHKWVMEQMRQGKVIAVPNAGVKTYVMHIKRDDKEYKEFMEKLEEEQNSKDEG